MKFIKKYHEHLRGAIKGFDRVRFRGTLRRLTCVESVGKYLSMRSILLKDFKEYVDSQTCRLVKHVEARAAELGIPHQYLASATDKEKLAREYLGKQAASYVGPICVLSAVEQCFSPSVVPNRESKMIELRILKRKCKHMYFYFQHPQFGFGHVRLQTWLPFQVTINLNGRHWLERQLLEAGIEYRKEANCFTWLSDVEAAQELLLQQRRSDWPELLGGLLNDCFAGLSEKVDLFEPDGYYWTASETEFATDYMFRDARELDRLFPMMIRHAMLVSDAPAVLRYLGRKPEATGGPVPGEVFSDVRRRREGVRIKHRSGANSIKAYNKQRNILRIETTINDPSRFKSFRSPNDDPSREKTWLPMRKGVADLNRRCEVSEACNERYAEALAGTPTNRRFSDEVLGVSRPVIKAGRRFRALNPWSKSDYQLMEFIGQGSHAINGFRNKDLSLFIMGGSLPVDPVEKRRLTGRMSRLIRLLREHGLVRKIPRENRYMIQPKGMQLAKAILSANNMEINKMVEVAA